MNQTAVRFPLAARQTFGLWHYVWKLLRLRLTINAGTPTIRELAVRKKGGQWSTLATNVTPEFRVVSGLRRATQQQTEPLEGSASRSQLM